MTAMAVCSQDAKVPENIQRYLDRSKQQKEWDIGTLETRIKDVTAQVNKSRGKASAKTLADHLKNLKSELVELRKPDTHRPARMDPLKIMLNDIGEFDTEAIKEKGSSNVGVFRASQVIDANAMIVVFETFRGATTSNPGEIKSDPIWIQGVSTKGVVDGKVIDMPGVFEIAGTKRYATVDGSSRTVFIAKPVDVKPFLKK